MRQIFKNVKEKLFAKYRVNKALKEFKRSKKIGY